MTPATQALLELARLSLALGRTERITRHEDGERFETVAEHTVMLGWVSLSLAHWFPWLNRGEIARFALCHDAPEAICGDTPTLRISDEERAAKADREAAAIERITAETSNLPWLANAIDDYETGKDGYRPAAAFVRAVDKLLPKLTHVLNGGVALRESGIGSEELSALLLRQRNEIDEGFRPLLVELQRELSEMTLALPLEPKS